MTGPELYALCKSLADDPDESFMSKQDWANALQMGYASYQQYVGDSIPEIYEKPYDFALSAQSEKDFNGILFGATPSVGKVAYRITKIHTVNVGQQPDFGLWLQPAATMEQLWNITSTTGYGNFNPGKWCLQGTMMKYNLQLTGNYRLYYLPNGPTAAEWLTLITTPASFVDNTPDFAQQCIAFFAYSQYAIKDWSQNDQLQSKFDQLLRQLDQWVAKNRTGDAHRWVQPGRQGLQGGGGWW